MKLLIKVLRKEAVKLLENDIRLEVIGDMEMIPDDVRKTLDETIELTRKTEAWP